MGVFACDMKELRAKLKLVDRYMSKEGYELRHSAWGYGMSIYRDNFSDAYINSYLKFTMNILPSGEYENGTAYVVSFTVEPCRVDLGNSAMALSKAKELHKYLGHCIKVCDYLNSLNIRGTSDMFRTLVTDIERRRLSTQ